MAQSSTPNPKYSPVALWGFEAGRAEAQGRGLNREGRAGGWAEVATGRLSPTDFIDIVKDPVPPSEYKTEEDPKLFHSLKTQRGPLSDNWIEEYRQQVFPIMCAYKLCKVEFRYWGMQSKIERFIHDTGEPAGALRVCLWSCASRRLPGADPGPPQFPTRFIWATG